MEYSKLCPKCGERQVYCCKSVFTMSIKENRMCLKCLGKHKRKHNGIFRRNCITCGKLLNYTCRQGLNLAIKHNSSCRNCATKETAKHIDRSFQRTNEYRKKMSISCSGKKITEETREKLRIAKIKQIKEKGTKINYNPHACVFMDDFGKKNGFHFQHALNGGEKMIAGYFLDGYDQRKKIVFEYDEPKHNILSVNKKDKIREKRIVERLQPVMFFRYNEQFGKLFEIISGKEWM